MKICYFIALYRGQKSEIGTFELKSRCLQSYIPSRGSRGEEFVSLPLPAYTDCLYFLPTGLFPPSKQAVAGQLFHVISFTLTHLLPSSILNEPMAALEESYDKT